MPGGPAVGRMDGERALRMGRTSAATGGKPWTAYDAASAISLRGLRL